MSPRVKLSEVNEALDEIDYPVTRIDAAHDLEPYTVEFAGGEDNLGALVSETGSDTFKSSEELLEELYVVLPTDAVGELGQSEGEG